MSSSEQTSSPPPPAKADKDEEDKEEEEEEEGPSPPNDAVAAPAPVLSRHELHKQDPEKYSDTSSSSAEDDEDVLDGALGGAVSEEMLRQMLGMHVSDRDRDGHREDVPKVLSEVSFAGIVDYIRSGRARNVITMAGAGISTSAGIPDFRTPGSGLYDNLQKYNLPDPQAIFTLEYFRHKPEAFFKLAKELYPGRFEPTPSHYFVKLLSSKGLLLRHYTQNIDTLERCAGIDDDKLVEAHGTFHKSHCIDRRCKKEYSQQWMKDCIFSDVVPTCERCNSLVKPDIVFFGEQLPDRFHDCVVKDFPKCDLLIIMGTSLTVQPFAGLVDRVPTTCPRLLINMTKAGDDGTDFVLRLLGRGGLDFDPETSYRDVAKLGKCDEGCFELAEALGWKEDLQQLIDEGSSKTKEEKTD